MSITCAIAYGASGLVRLLHLVWSVIECSDVFYAFKFGAMVRFVLGPLWLISLRWLIQMFNVLSIVCAYLLYQWF